VHHKEQDREFVLIIDEITTWVSKHFVKKTSVAAFMSKHCRYTVYSGDLPI